jgi:hypothetical protein
MALDQFFLSLVAGNTVASQQANWVVMEAAIGKIMQNLTQLDMAEATAISEYANAEPSAEHKANP